MHFLKLGGKLEEIGVDNDTIIFMISFWKEETKIQLLEQLPENDELLSSIIDSLNLNKETIMNLNQNQKEEIIRNYSGFGSENIVELFKGLNEQKREELLIEKIHDLGNSHIQQILETFETEKRDEIILSKLLDKIDRKEKLIENLSMDKRLEALEKVEDTRTRNIVIKMLDDDTKIQLINQLEKSFDRFQVAATLSDDRKEEVLAKVEGCQLELINTIASDDKKSELLDIFSDEQDKILIIQGMKQEEKKLKALEKLSTIDSKEKVLSNISKEDVSNFLKKNKGKDDVEIYLKFAIGNDQEILEIIGNTYGLDDEQKQIISKLYEKNDDVLQTINYKILDKKYMDLQEKLSIITSYEDIQEKICNLDGQSYQIFIQTLKSHEEKNGEWINFTDKIITNLTTKQYTQLIQDISGKELTDADIEKIGNILCKDNIFNIKNLDEVRNYEQIKNQVCDALIKQDSNLNLQGYPQIEEMSNLDRMKLATSMKVYGQTLEEVSNLIEIYGQDIDSLEVNDKNEPFILYMQSLKIIKNTDDEQLLKDIYENSQTISLEDAIDVEFIEKKLKDIYLETFNKNLYKPQEEYFQEMQIIDGVEVPIYNARTEFGMSITSIEAYVQSVNGKNKYKEDWNRPKTKSQGYCTSYIRNDMLATAPIGKVVYGFDEYDEGSLMLSGTHDIASKAASFKPFSDRQMNFNSENSQIDKSSSYNEMVMNRYNSDGTRKQPDYVVFIKEGKNKDEIIWENTLKAASEFGIPIVIIDKLECAKSESEKIKNMMDEYIAIGDEKILQDIQQRYSNNQNGNTEFFTQTTWEKMWQEKGVSQIPDLPSREEIVARKEQNYEITREELKEVYDEISQEEKENGIEELKRRAKEITLYQINQKGRQENDEEQK